MRQYAARNNVKVMLIDGDGNLYQHIQELETVRRHGIKREWRENPVRRVLVALPLRDV